MPRRPFGSAPHPSATPEYSPSFCPPHTEGGGGTRFRAASAAAAAAAAARAAAASAAALSAAARIASPPGAPGAAAFFGLMTVTLRVWPATPLGGTLTLRTKSWSEWRALT